MVSILLLLSILREWDETIIAICTIMIKGRYYSILIVFVRVC